MANVKHIAIHKGQEVMTIRNMMTTGGSTLILTDDDNFINKYKDTTVMYIGSIESDTVKSVIEEHRDVDRVIVTRVGMINKYCTERVSVKLISAGYIFSGFKNDVFILNDYAGDTATASNTKSKDNIKTRLNQDFETRKKPKLKK